MECFERELHEYVLEVERDVLAEELARLDVDLPAVTIEGEVYRQVVRCEETYTSAAGAVRVMRSLYRRLGEGERTLCPLELRAGIVEGAVDAARRPAGDRQAGGDPGLGPDPRYRQ